MLSSIKCELEFTSENSPWSPAKWHLCSFHHHFYFSFPTFFALTRSLLPFFIFYMYFSRSGSASLPLCRRRGCGQCRMSAPLPGSVTSFLPGHTPVLCPPFLPTPSPFCILLSPPGRASCSSPLISASSGPSPSPATAGALEGLLVGLTSR